MAQSELDRLLIKNLRETIQQLQNTLSRYQGDRQRLAMLAADGPCFDNPLAIYAAKQVRDEVLKEMGVKPDGTKG